ALVQSFTAPAGGLCGHNPCWSAKTTSIAYRNHLASSTGVTAVRLREGLIDGKASIAVTGRGAKLPMPSLASLVGPVDVQLHRSSGGPCGGATYSAPFAKDDGATFKDKND